MTLMTMALKAALVLVLTALLARSAKNSSAALRHLIWMTGLTATLLLPLATFLLPRWQVLPVSGAIEPAITFAIGNTLSPSVIAETTQFLPSLVMIWLAGVVTMLGAMLTGRLALQRWARRARPVSSPEWRATIAEAIRTDRLASRVRFLEAEWARPCTWGIIRPTVLLPVEGASWTPELRRYALTHELAHIRRLDPVAHTLARLVCAVHWYNPLAWIAARSAGLAREQACDDAVLGASPADADYAGFLVQVARNGTPLRSPEPALGLAHRSTLATRVRALLDPARRRGPVRRSMLAGVVTVGLGLLVSLAALAPAQEPARPQPRQQQRQDTLPRVRAADSAAVHKVVYRVCSDRSSADSTRAGEIRKYTITLRDVTAGRDSAKIYTVAVRCTP